MTPEALNTFFSICIGFALAGALVNGYQALAQRPAGFGLLQDGVAPPLEDGHAVLGGAVGDEGVEIGAAVRRVGLVHEDERLA